MNQEITINKTDIAIKEYQGKRVVTFKDIDACHNRPEGTARKRFNDNKKRFIEGEDFFKITPSEFRTAFGSMDKRQQNDITLLTESGYLMLVKSFTDDLAWDVQRELVNTYFRVENHEPSFDISKVSEVLLTPDFIIQLATVLKGEQEKNKALTETVESQEKEIEVIKPKSEYCDRILSTPDLLTITEIAKDYGITAAVMNVILHELGIIYYQHNTWLVYQKFVSEGFAKNNTLEYLDKRGHLRASQSLQWTHKGRLYIYNLLRQHGIYPLEEIGYKKLNDESELVQKCKQKLGHTSKFKAIPRKTMKKMYDLYKGKKESVKSITEKLGICYQTFYRKVEKYETNPRLAVY